MGNYRIRMVKKMKPTVKLASLLTALLMMISVIASGCSLGKEWAFKTSDKEIPIGVYITAMYNAYFEAQEYASKLDDYDASSDKWLELEITDDEGNTEVASKWIKQRAERNCLEMLAIEAELDKQGATLDEANIAQMENQADMYWVQGMKKTLQDKGVSQESFKYYLSRYSLEKSQLFDSLYLAGGSKEVSKDEIIKYFEENYIRYSYLPVALYEATTDEAGEVSNAITDEQAKKITDTLDGYVKQVNAVKDATEAGTTSDKLTAEYISANGMDENALVTGTAPKEETNAPADEINEALKKLEEGKATTVKVGEGASATVYYVFRYSTAAAKNEYLADDTHNDEIVRNMKKQDYEDYLTDLIDKMDYQKGSGVDSYDPKMFFTKPESSASTVTA